MEIRSQAGSLALARDLSIHQSRGLEERVRLTGERARAERVSYLTGEPPADMMPQREFFPSRRMSDAARPSAPGLRVDRVEISAAGLARLGR